MSLRWRLALVLALISAGTTVVVSLFAYQASASELVAQIDLDLHDAQVQLELPAPAAHPGTQGPPRPAPGSLFLPGSPLPTSAPSGSPPIAAVQHLDAAGGVDNGNAVLAIPIQPVDRTIARQGGRPVIRDERIGGHDYRVLTAATNGGGALQVAISLSGVEGAEHHLLWRFVLTALVVAVVAALAGYLLATRIARPLERLTAAAASVARTGALELGMENPRRDETGRLGTAIERMLASLRRSREEQRQLVQDAGHELRTPLTSVRSNVDLLAMHGPRLTEEDRARLVGSAREELTGLVHLIEELVELATDTAAAEELTLVDMDRLVRGAANRCESRTGRRIVVTTEPWRVVGRSQALERAVSNLLENAVKFSPDGTPVELEALRGRVAVRDHGPGIARSDLERVFDRFYRAPSTETRQGSGLGLSIVRKVAGDHDGHVFAENAPGGGAVVGFEIPPG